MGKKKSLYDGLKLNKDIYFEKGAILYMKSLKKKLAGQKKIELIKKDAVI